LLIKKASNKLGPVEFVHRLTIPVLDRAVIVDNNFRCASKEKAKVLDNNIFVMEVRTFLLSFVLAACGEHASGGGVMRTANNFTQETKLMGSDHVLDTWDAVKNSPYFFIADVVVLDFGDRYVKDTSDATVEKYFKAAEEGLLQRPRLTPPEQ
jgi:hypothetical protein